MHERISRFFAVTVICAIVFSTPTFAGGEAGNLLLRDVGAKFIGHTTDRQDDGSLNVLNPMFVQYFLPVERQHEYPLVLVHGGGGQGTDWLETPDGRDGWVDYFIADGWDVYIVDRPGHGRSQSNSSCGNGSVQVANTAIISMLADSHADVWPGGEPTPTNDAVIKLTASVTTAPYCGDETAAKGISVLLDEIGPAILVAHSAGGGAAFRVPDLNREKVIGIIAYEAEGSSPVAPGRRGRPPLIHSLTAEPELSADFEVITTEDGCLMQGNYPSQLVGFTDMPVILTGSEMGRRVTRNLLECEAAAWRQAGADAKAVYMPDHGLRGGGHFAMSQLDNAKYVRLFIELATNIEATAN